MKFLMGESVGDFEIAIGFGKSAIGSDLRYALEKCCRGLERGNSTWGRSSSSRPEVNSSGRSYRNSLLIDILRNFRKRRNT